MSTITTRDFEFIRGMMQPGEVETIMTADGSVIDVQAGRDGAYEAMIDGVLCGWFLPSRMAP